MQILNFLTNEDTFKHTTIDEITHEENLHDFTVIDDHCSLEKALDEVKYVPNSIVRLKIFYNLQDKFKSIPNNIDHIYLENQPYKLVIPTPLLDI